MGIYRHICRDLKVLIKNFFILYFHLNHIEKLIISHASEVMLKILQARLQKYMNRELPDFQAGFRKGRGTGDQIANIRWIFRKATEFQKNTYFCFIDYAKASVCVDHKPPDLPPEKPVCRQEATVRTVHGTDWLQIRKKFKAVYCSAQSLSCVRLCETPWTVVCQAPLYMGLSRQEYWSGLPFPPPRLYIVTLLI